MSQLKSVRTGLDVGFASGELPERFVSLKGNGAWRSIPLAEEFPFEDAQFEAVVLSASAVSLNTVREAHRVLRPNGSLYFIVPEKSARQNGWTMPEIYGLLREGYNIIDVDRPKWFYFGFRGRTFTIRAVKKNWRALGGATYRPYIV